MPSCFLFPPKLICVELDCSDSKTVTNASFFVCWFGFFLIFLHLHFLGEACTIVLRGATQQILDEAERSLHDALCVLAQTVKDTRTVYGGGEY